MMSTARAAQRQEYADGYRDGKQGDGYWPPGPPDEPHAHTYTRGYVRGCNSQLVPRGYPPMVLPQQ